MPEQPKLEPCGHCTSTGTCKNGNDGGSCAVCARRNFLFKHSPAYGLVCTICKGSGFLEPMSTRIKHRTGPLIAIYVILTAVASIFFGYKEHFNEVLTFLSTLTGSITGYYFSRKE
ncbi:molecular chaperone DnaJ [Methylomonas methanica]|uniref:molecular chaperone DnaJ n=1 Tax=Methylomonas methanica TaxID=421 RepID=UPI0011D1A424|nr:molecular chaperone DnaJ [Methylomonas methanica]